MAIFPSKLWKGNNAKVKLARQSEARRALTGAGGAECLYQTRSRRRAVSQTRCESENDGWIVYHTSIRCGYRGKSLNGLTRERSLEI